MLVVLDDGGGRGAREDLAGITAPTLVLSITGGWFTPTALHLHLRTA
ncbi:hypothetical protein ABZ614_13960 [Streptomyces sp. NPDC013178]